MKHASYLFVFFCSIMLCSCDSKDKLMLEFERCYPPDKLATINNTTQYLDEVIAKKFPEQTLLKSYQQFAMSWSMDAGFPDKVFNKEQIEILRHKFKTEIMLKEFYYFDENGYKQISWESHYLTCLKKIEEKRIQIYLNRINQVGSYLSSSFIISAWLNDDVPNYDELHRLIIKLELIIMLAKSQN